MLSLVEAFIGFFSRIIPPTLSPGAYYLGACADDVNAIAESNESNNCLVSTSTVTLVPPSMSLSFNGKVRDKVGRADAAVTADGSLDGTFTVTLQAGSGNRTVTGLDLRRWDNGGIWNTATDNSWVLGAAGSLDGPLYNASDGSVNFALNEGGSFSVFAADSSTGSYFYPGSTFDPAFNLTVSFADGTTAFASVTIHPLMLMSLSFNGKIRDKVGPGNTALTPNGQMDGTFTVTLNPGSGNRTVTSLNLTRTGGAWDTLLSSTGNWALGAAGSLDSALYNASDASVNFAVSEGGSFNLFASDGTAPTAYFTPGSTFNLTANFADGTTLSASVTLPPPPPPPSMTMTFNGKLRDKVGQGNTALTPNGQMDGTFTVTVNPGSGNRTVTSLDLARTAGGRWDTFSSTTYWALGAAGSLDGPLYNAGDASVNFAVTDGGSFNVFASDSTSGNTYFTPGSTYTLTAKFADGSTATAAASNVPIIISLSRTSGPVGTAVTINGFNFGATQGTSTVKFNGVIATPSGWSNTSITAPVPTSATTGAVVVTLSGAASNSVTFLVTTRLGIATINGGSPPSAGSPFSVVVQAGDAAGNPATVNAATGVSLSLATGTGTLGGTLTGTIAAGADQVTITGVTYSKPETGVVVTANRASGDVLTSGNSASFTVGAGVATKLAFIAQPANANAGGAVPGPPTIAVQDASGATVTSATVPIAITIGTNPSGGTLSGTTTKNAVSGITSFGDLSINLAGNGYTLAASATGLTGATSATFNVGQAGTIAGSVTRAGGGSGIGGALVEALQSGVVRDSDLTDANGGYSIPGLVVGTYDVRASAGGYATQTQAGTSVTSGATTTANFSLSDVAETSGVLYVYDELQRLTAVINPIGEAARYEYDAVGNLLSVARYNSSQVSIIEFTPNNGPVGTAVTIYGTGFSTTPSQNTVTFNGLTGTVTSSTATQIVTSVPTGGSTGPISVTAPSGSATSSAPFTVTSSSNATTITGFSPTVGAPGTTVTITGTKFDTTPWKNAVALNITRTTVSSATATSITTSVPSGSGSGRISVATAFGKAISAADFFIPPSPYTAADAEFVGRMTIGGNSLTATIGTSGKIGLVVFDAIAGQTVDLGINSISMAGALKIYDPKGGLAVTSSNVSTSTNIDLQPSITGTYTILIDPSGTSTGAITLTLSEEADAGPIFINGPSAVITINRVGQRARVIFGGNQGQQVTVAVAGNTMGDITVTLLKPDGTQQTSTTSSASSFNLVTQTLPVAGTYILLVDPSGTNTGSLNLSVTSP